MKTTTNEQRKSYLSHFVSVNVFAPPGVTIARKFTTMYVLTYVEDTATYRRHDYLIREHLLHHNLAGGSGKQTIQVQVPEVIQRSHAQSQSGHSSHSGPVQSVPSLYVLLDRIADSVESTTRTSVDEQQPLGEKPFAILYHLELLNVAVGDAKALQRHL